MSIRSSSLRMAATPPNDPVTLPDPPTFKLCPECGAEFFGTAKKLRCSQRCTWRASRRVWRKRQVLRAQLESQEGDSHGR